jgi:hypothetical protein
MERQDWYAAVEPIQLAMLQERSSPLPFYMFAEWRCRTIRAGLSPPDDDGLTPLRDLLSGAVLDPDLAGWNAVFARSDSTYMIRHYDALLQDLLAAGVPLDWNQAAFWLGFWDYVADKGFTQWGIPQQTFEITAFAMALNLDPTASGSLNAVRRQIARMGLKTVGAGTIESYLGLPGAEDPTARAELHTLAGWRHLYDESIWWDYAMRDRPYDPKDYEFFQQTRITGETLEAARQHLDAAKAHFGAAMKDKPGWAEPELGLAQALRREGTITKDRAKWESSNKRLHSLRSYADRLLCADLLLHLNSSDLGDPAGAQQALERALAHAAEPHEVWMALAGFLRLEQRLEEAARAAMQSVAAGPEDPRLWRDVAFFCDSISRSAEAIEAYSGLAKRDPSEIQALLRLAELQAQNGQPGPAGDSLAAALARDPGNFVTWRSLRLAAHVWGRKLGGPDSSWLAEQAKLLEDARSSIRSLEEKHGKSAASRAELAFATVLLANPHIDSAGGAGSRWSEAAAYLIEARDLAGDPDLVVLWAAELAQITGPDIRKLTDAVLDEDPTWVELIEITQNADQAFAKAQEGNALGDLERLRSGDFGMNCGADYGSARTSDAVRDWEFQVSGMMAARGAMPNTYMWVR